MKKYVALLIALVMLLALAVPTAFAEDKAEYVITLANPSNPEDNVVKAFYYFEQIVEERSNGRIDVQVYDSGQLGSHADCIDSMQLHSLVAAEVNTSVLGNIDPAFSIFDLPYLADGMDGEIEVIASGLGDVLDQRLQDAANLKIVGWFVRSPRSIYTSKGPASCLADLAGTKIRNTGTNCDGSVKLKSDRNTAGVMQEGHTAGNHVADCDTAADSAAVRQAVNLRLALKLLVDACKNFFHCYITFRNIA